MAAPMSTPIARAVEETRPMDLPRYPGFGVVLRAVLVKRSSVQVCCIFVVSYPKRLRVSEAGKTSIESQEISFVPGDAFCCPLYCDGFVTTPAAVIHRANGGSSVAGQRHFATFG